MAGRLSFAASVTAGKVGRAHIKPFFAQAYAPLRGEGASCWLLQAAAWWLVYLAEVPAIVHS
eukprot:4918630-Pyramimonas_sp.AAC.1